MNLECSISIYSGGPGSGCIGPTCGRKSTGSIYHVTHTKLVPKIQKEGLRPMQTSNWVKQGSGERYGKGEINSFENPNDALRWAAKMDWTFNKATGSGKVSIIKLDRGSEPWKADTTSDPLGQAMSKGKWLKYAGGIPADRIQSVTQFKPEHVKYLTHDSKETPKL
jgi:hypothetical protein